MRNQPVIFRSISAALVLAAVSVAPEAAVAESANGGLPGGWLSQYTGSRSAGLGGAYVADTRDPISAVWNPAGLNQLFQNEVRFESSQLFEDTSINTFGVVFPARKLPTVGFTMVALRSGEFERTSELNESLGDFSQADTAFILSLAKSVNRRVDIGANVKFVRQSVEEFDAGGVGMDLGVQFQATPTLRLGTSFLNVGGPSLELREVSESYASELRTGLAYRLFNGKALLALELNKPSGGSATFHTGSEFWLQSNMAVRLGYDDSNIAGGFSYHMPSGFGLDYGVSDHELGVTHRFGISYRFGGFFASTQASPEVFSPTGSNSVTKFHLQSRTKEATSRWELVIVDKFDTVVRRFGGQGEPPAHVLWDGKDESGLPLADGLYQYRLTTHDAGDRLVASREQTVEILTGGPQGSTSVKIQ